MRKTNTRALERQRRLGTYAIKRLAKKRSARLKRRRQRERRDQKLSVTPLSFVTVTVPRSLLFHGSTNTRRTFDAFINDVNAALGAERSVRLDFAKTERLYPCGLLLFLGWLNDWLAGHPGKLTCTYPTDDLVEQMLQSAKVLERLGCSPRKVITHSDVTRWHQFEGDEVDGTPIEPFHLEVRAATSVEWQLGLGGCISEALTNVKKHAYAEGASTRWWMFATVNSERRQVFVAMHDHGQSIPATLLAKPEVVDIVTLRKLRRGGDCELIAAAAGGRTRTKLYYRGKGLPEMVDFTSRGSRNALAIYSRKGYFRQQGCGLGVKGTLSEPVRGTLVIWTLNFEPKL